MSRAGILETRGAKLIVALICMFVLAVAAIALWSLPAKALPCNPDINPDCPTTQQITNTLTVTNNGSTHATITSSDNKINCGSTCSAQYRYTITCTASGGCTEPDYATVTLSASATNGFALSGWGGDCSGSGPCSVTMDADKTVSASFADVQNPTVSLTSPNANAIVSGNAVNLSASASDNAGVSKVDFLFDGIMTSTDTIAPYAVSLDSTQRSDGRHTVGARATDTAGRISSTVTRSVIVDNHAPTVLNNSTSPNPRPGAKAPRNTNVSVTFSEEMDTGSLTSSTFKLQQYNAKKRKYVTIPATISFSDANKTAILDPYGAAAGGVEKLLGANKTLKATVTTGAKDIAHHAMASKFVWKFKTGSS